MSYEKDVRIDNNDLTGEWLEQPTLMMKYNDLYAIAAFERDTLKVKLEYTSALVDSEIRKNFTEFGFVTKPTEAAIKNAVCMDKRYRKIAKDMLSAAKNANFMAGARVSFEHRKKALENLVTLLVTGLHSEPKNKGKIIEKKLNSKKLKKFHRHNKNILKGGKRNHMIGK